MIQLVRKLLQVFQLRLKVLKVRINLKSNVLLLYFFNTDDSNEIKFTVWMQWTITRLRMKLYGYDMTNMTSNHFSYLSPPTLKLVFELEDIMTSLDLQQIYSKFKLKIVTANILHYRR